MARFVFHVFKEQLSAGPTEVLTGEHATLAAAKAAAKRLAKENDSPVDLAYDDGREWDRAYIGTAQPFDALMGTHFGRLD